jgi:hypothetical protein
MICSTNLLIYFKAFKLGCLSSLDVSKLSITLLKIKLFFDSKNSNLYLLILLATTPFLSFLMNPLNLICLFGEFNINISNMDPFFN